MRECLCVYLFANTSIGSSASMFVATAIVVGLFLNLFLLNRKSSDPAWPHTCMLSFFVQLTWLVSWFKCLVRMQMLLADASGSRSLRFLPLSFSLYYIRHSSASWKIFHLVSGWLLLFSKYSSNTVKDDAD